MNYRQYLQKNKIDITKDDIVFELSNLISEARLYAGISQAELAKRMGTQQPSIARAENGELEPSVSFLQKVAKAVNTTFIPPKFGFMMGRDHTGNSRVLALPVSNDVSMSITPETISPLYYSTKGGSGYFTTRRSTSVNRVLQIA